MSCAFPTGYISDRDLDDGRYPPQPRPRPPAGACGLLDDREGVGSLVSLPFGALGVLTCLCRTGPHLHCVGTHAAGVFAELTEIRKGPRFEMCFPSMTWGGTHECPPTSRPPYGAVFAMTLGLG